MKRTRTLALILVTVAAVTAGCTGPDVRSAEGPPPSTATTVALVVDANPRHSRPPVVPSCPEPSPAPSMALGRYCGPEPPAGNGAGQDGVGLGTETAPPCGTGVEPGRYYAYTVPLRCDGALLVDGRRWIAGLMPPADMGTMHVWVSLRPSGDGGGFIGPSAAVGFEPDRGQAGRC